MPAPEHASDLSGRLRGGVVRPLLVCPDPVLRRPCEPAGYLGAWAMQGLAADLLATLRAAGGEGISAPQIGVSRRMAVIADGAGVLVLCDAELLAQHGPQLPASERCLSWPGGEACPARAGSITLAWYDLDGRHLRQDLTGPLARVAQRQLDVLGGRFIGGF